MWTAIAISGSGLTAANYSFVQAAGNARALTIKSATLLYVADAASRIAGAANPRFGGAVTGFVNGENWPYPPWAALSGITATAESPAGKLRDRRLWSIDG